MSEETIITRKTNFTVVDNGFINDPALSWRAKGILLYMMSKPAGWKYNPKGDMLKRAKDGRDALYSGIKELINARYISRTRDSGGFLTYHVFEDKDDNKIHDYMSLPTDPEKPDPEKPDPEKPDPEKPDVLVNTDSSNTDNSNTEDSKDTPPGDGDIPEPKEEKFNGLKELIKRGADKQRAKDLISNRKTRRLAVLTLSIVDHMETEANKAGLSLAEVVELCSKKGWGGFEARYYQESRPVNQSSHDLSTQDRSKDENQIPQWMLDLEKEGANQ